MAKPPETFDWLVVSHGVVGPIINPLKPYDNQVVFCNHAFPIPAEQCLQRIAMIIPPEKNARVPLPVPSFALSYDRNIFLVAHLLLVDPQNNETLDSPELKGRQEARVYRVVI